MSKHIRDKYQMWMARGATYARCDLCGKRLGNPPECEKHEIFHRSKSTPDAQSYDLIMDRALCALLCPSCHRAWHDTDINRDDTIEKIFQRKYTIPGEDYETVKTAYEKLQSVAKYKLPYTLPLPK